MQQEPMSENARDDERQIIAGRNAVLEALSAETPLECVYILSGDRSGALGRIAGIAREHGVPVKEAAATKLRFLTGTENHQGAAAVCSAAGYSELSDILARAGEEPLFVIVCDGIEDPHNLGAIIRTAEAAGAHGVIIPKRRSAGLTAATAKASAGAVMHLPVARVANLASTVDELKKQGVWFFCADMDGSPWNRTDFSGAVGLVVGSEGEGVSRLLREKCDAIVSLPMRGKVNSLNASVAAGIIMYEVVRTRLSPK